MPKVEIDIDQILTCAVTLEAEPGDQLLVLNGVVIAMVQRRDRAIAEAEEQPRRRGRVADPASVAPYSIAMQSKLASQVLEHMRRQDKPMTAEEIRQSWPRKRGEEPPRIGWALGFLRRDGTIEATTNSRKPAYRLTELPAPPS